MFAVMKILSSYPRITLESWRVLAFWFTSQQGKYNWEGHQNTFKTWFYLCLRFLTWRHRKINGRTDLDLHSTNGLRNLDNISLADVKTNISFMIISCFLVSLNKYVKSLSIEEMNEYPHYISLHIFQLLGPCLIGFSFTLIFYFRHPELKKKIINFFKFWTIM